MLSRTIFMLSDQSNVFYKLQNITKTCSQRRHNISIALPLQQLNFGHYNYLFISSVLNYLVHQLDFKFLHSVATNDAEKLSEQLLPEELEIAGKKNEIKQILSHLLSRGYTSKDIKENFLTYLKSKDISYSKLNLLEAIDPDIKLLMPLLTLPKATLKVAAQNSKADEVGNFANRIQYLAHHLELEVKELVPAIARHSSLLTMNFKRLDVKMNILKSANINPKYIVKDLWIFNYKEDLIESRIQAALKAGVELKPWMLRCSEKIFLSIISKHSEAHRILGDENVISYLAKRLDCNEEYVEYLMLRNKLLKSINVHKLEQVINFLYDKGYTPQEVRIFPRVFCSSVQSLEKRFEELLRVKKTLPTIPQLCMLKRRKDHSESIEET